MIMRRASAWLVLLCAACLPAGCAAGRVERPPLPATPWPGDDRVVDLLADRTAAMSTLSSGVRVTFRDPRGRIVQLEGALAAQRDTGVRLRAWKLGSAVLDLTSRPDGDWLWTERDLMQNQVPFSDNRRTLLNAWWLATGGLFEEARDTADGDTPIVHHADGTFTVTARPDTFTITCTVDRETIVPLAYRIEADGRHGTVELSDYTLVDGHAFPLRWTIRAERYRVVFEFHDVELGGDLPEQALRPPARATKLP